MERSLFNQAGLRDVFHKDYRIDIRDRDQLNKAVSDINPEVIVHLAAQPLVRESYKSPIETFETNVIGTLNLLEATKPLSNLMATLIITTDKVYKNHNQLRGYVESDEIGGDDPYSASKAAADIAAQSWIKSYGKSPIAVARAGNVIGGGDWAEDRIIPDLVNSFSRDEEATLRYPDAIRPWQHVLDCLNGYLLLIKRMLQEGSGGEWNFGPSLENKYSVAELVEAFAMAFGKNEPYWKLDSSNNPHEAGYLLLDSNKARTYLNWSDKLGFVEAVQLTADWYKLSEESSAREICLSQIEFFFGFNEKP
jgi:CDP-glucose 4,6-dehydratase